MNLFYNLKCVFYNLLQSKPPSSIQIIDSQDELLNQMRFQPINQFVKENWKKVENKELRSEQLINILRKRNQNQKQLNTIDFQKFIIIRPKPIQPSLVSNKTQDLQSDLLFKPVETPKWMTQQNQSGFQAIKIGIQNQSKQDTQNSQCLLEISKTYQDNQNENIYNVKQPQLVCNTKLIKPLNENSNQFNNFSFSKLDSTKSIPNKNQLDKKNSNSFDEISDTQSQSDQRVHRRIFKFEISDENQNIKRQKLIQNNANYFVFPDIQEELKESKECSIIDDQF